MGFPGVQCKVSENIFVPVLCADCEGIADGFSRKSAIENDSLPSRQVNILQINKIIFARARTELFGAFIDFLRDGGSGHHPKNLVHRMPFFVAQSDGAITALRFLSELYFQRDCLAGFLIGQSPIPVGEVPSARGNSIRVKLWIQSSELLLCPVFETSDRIEQPVSQVDCAGDQVMSPMFRTIAGFSQRR